VRVLVGLVFTAMLSLLALRAVVAPAQPPPAVVRVDPAPPGAGGSGDAGWVANQIVVRFESSAQREFEPAPPAGGKTGIRAVDAVSQRYGAVSMEPLFRGAHPRRLAGRLFDLSTFYRVTFAGPVDPPRAAADYEALAAVKSAQPIGVHTLYATPNDPDFVSQWHLDQPGGPDVGATGAWDLETGDGGVIVAILDSGVRYFHKDLGGGGASYADPTAAEGNMWINQAEKNGAAGVDDDGNGYVDDWIGWDFVDGASHCWTGEDCNTEDNDPRDFNGHGTHCAGNVAAINNNGYAASSAAGGWGDGTLQATANGVKIMACRVGWSSRLYLSEVGKVRMDFAAQALYYAANNGARIASCSWGSSDSGGLGEAVDYFVASGGLLFHSAGNDRSETPDYLGERADVVNVAATDQDDCRADFSNHGAWVDVCAPGVSILSTWHNHRDPSGDYTAEISGTSMATPIAAGVAALVWSQDKNRTAAQVRQILEDTCDDIDDLPCNSGDSGKLGAGRINARAALDAGTPTAARAGPDGRETLMSNYPNPFHPTTTLRFTQARPGPATLEIFDVRGRRVETLVARELDAGVHTFEWNASALASGVYFGRLIVDGKTTWRRLVLLK
jgi:subtilisin family serine protease